MGIAPNIDMKRLDGTQMSGRDKIKSLSLIRYADDFVVLHEDLEVIKLCKVKIEEWLSDLSLELKPSKTRISHTLNQVEDEKPGFNFLGFNIRQFPVGKYQSGKNRRGLLGFKTIITPSKESQKRHYHKVSEVIKMSRGIDQVTLIKKLNPIIRGWCNYYSTVVSEKIFSRIWHLVVHKLLKWGLHRHRNKGRRWIQSKYFHTVGGDNWTFSTREDKNPLILRKARRGKQPKRQTLRQHSDTDIIRHVKVKGNASPYDGDWVYWSTRMGNHPEVPKRVSTLLKRQKGKCSHCGSYFKDGDSLEVDHIVPKSKGGKNKYDNWQLLHRHCHDTKTAKDGSLGNKSTCNSGKPKPPVKSEPEF